MHKLKLILLVDDDQITNYINLKLLKKMNLAEEIVVLNNGIEALKFLENKPPEKHPEWIFIDLNMPVMDGMEFIIRWQKIKINDFTKIFILSSTNDIRDFHFASNNKIEFLSKPLTLQRVEKLRLKYLSDN